MTRSAAPRSRVSSVPGASRRRFLGWSTGSALALCIPPLLSGCGGGSDDASEEPPAGGPALSEARRHALLAELETQCLDLARDGVSKVEFLEALATFFAAQPECARTGVDAETMSAWAYLNDGSLHVVSANLVKTPMQSLQPQRAQRAAAAAAELPGSPHARVLQAFGENFPTEEVAVAELRTLLELQGYAVRSGAAGEASLETLRHLAGDGFLQFTTHGGTAPLLQQDGGERIYCLRSSTLASPQLDGTTEVLEDVKNLRVTYHTAPNGLTRTNRWGEWTDAYDTRYGITQKFVSRYWQFASGAVVIVNAAHSGKTSGLNSAAGFVAACHRKGAGVYLGWSGAISSNAARQTPRYFVDRLLGANQVDPESPAQRAFPAGEVLADMQRRQLVTDSVTHAEFVAFPAEGALPALLAPSIHHMEVDEYRNELRLFGHFGSYEADSCRVEVEGSPLQVKRWEHGEIACELPVSGDGSSGRVQVRSRGRRSNVRHITEWRLQIAYRWAVPELTGPKVDAQALIRLRADVGPHREQPGTVPVEPLRRTIATRDSRMAAQASGTFPAGPCDITWQGSQAYPAIPDTAHSHLLVAYLRMDTAARKGWLGLALGAPGPDFTQNGCGASSGFAIGFGLLDSEQQFPLPQDPATTIPLRALELDFGPDYTLLGRHFNDGLTVDMQWSDVPPVSPPLPGDGV